MQSSKTGETKYLNYDDICYSTGEDNESFFDLYHVSDWGVVIAASANAMEVLYSV